MTSSPLRKEIDETLRSFVDRQRPLLLRISDDLAPLLSSLDVLLAGGKRLRPAFCYWAWRGAGRDHTQAAVTAAASLEMLQASALIHDDVMDSSDTRRGQPSVHRRFEALANGHGWSGAGPFGIGAAILVGDLCLTWSNEMFDHSGLPAEALHRGRPIYELMRTEVMAGQYLDLLEQSRGEGSVASALRVVEYKSAKYTIERPLHLGAALAGAPVATFTALTGYGLPLGIAFQLRDDVLGVFGDPDETGKPAGDDLREGKRTVLVAHAMERATAAQRDTLLRLLGDPALDLAGVTELREIITGTGALAATEEMIDSYARRAQDTLSHAPITDEAKVSLSELTIAATVRRG